MTRLLLILILSTTALAEPMSPRFHADTLDALWRAEGGHRARWAYGLKTAGVTCPVRGRELAGRLVHDHWRDWCAAGRPGPWATYLADRWCPPRADRTGNRNLRRNLTVLIRNASLRAATTP